MDKWVKKTCHMYIMEYYSAIKKDEIMSFVGKLNGSEDQHVR
jgi:hypothetical protein